MYSKEKIQEASQAERKRKSDIKARGLVITKEEGVRARSRVSWTGEVELEMLGGDRKQCFFAEFIYPRNEHGRVMLLNVTSHLLYDRDTGECLTSSRVKLDVATLNPVKISPDSLARLLSSRMERKGPKSITISHGRRRRAVQAEEDYEFDDSCAVAAGALM